MRMNRHLAGNQRDVFFAADLSDDKSAALMDRCPARQIWQRKSILAIAAIGGADQLKQRGILRDGLKLAVAEGPALGCKIAPDHSNFTDERLSHNLP